MKSEFRRPRFKRHYHVRIWPPETVVLFWEAGYRRLHSPLSAMLAPFLDGGHSFEAIVEALEGRASALDIWFGLDQLAEAGYLCEDDAVDDQDVATFCDVLNADASRVRNALASRSVRVHTVAKIDPQPMIQILRSMGIQCADEAELTIVLMDHPLQKELETFHADAVRTGKPWIMVKPIGSVIAFGPVFRSGGRPCWNCLAVRLKESPETQALFPLEDDKYSRFHLNAVRDGGLNLAAIEILKWLVTDGDPEIERTVFTLDAAAMSLQRHRLVSREDCKTCAPKSQRSSDFPAVPEIRMQFNARDARSDEAETVYEKYKHHVSSLAGVVHTLEPIGSHESGSIHVFGAGHNFALDAGRLTPPDRLSALSFGKGLSMTQARASALCEALERYSGLYRGNEYRRRARMRDLDGDVISPAACLNFSSLQYRNRQPWNGDGRAFVPASFDSAREIDWTPVWSLAERRFKYLPTACCFYGYPVDPDHDFARADSNGCAAGSTLEEAIFQGFLELVERDSMAIWWYNRLLRPAIDIRSIRQPRIREVEATYERLQRSLWVLDITADFGIPAVVAISFSNDPDGIGLLLGSGAHPDLGIAVISALTEMNQGLELSLQADRGEATPPLSREPFLCPDPAARETHYDEAAAPGCASLADCVELSKQRGLEMLVLDQTRGDVSLPVARVIVPGMRHFWRRLGPGRLYDVPVQLGWRATPSKEQELNPAAPGM